MQLPHLPADGLRSQPAGRRGLLSSAAALAAAALSPATLTMAADETTSSSPAPPRSPADLRTHLLKCLGGPWPDQGSLDAHVESSEQLPGFRRERIHYLVEPGERIAAWLLIPDGVSASSPAPGICVWHQHAGQYDVGKDEPAGVRAPNFGEMHQTGVALVREGYVVLCPDAAGFGERNHSFNTTVRNLRGRDLEHYLFGMYVAAGKCLAWKNISDMRRAVDYISTRPEVLPELPGCYGHSMGSTHTWQVGPWEPRTDHVLSPEMWRLTKAHFAKHLKR